MIKAPSLFFSRSHPYKFLPLYPLFLLREGEAPLGITPSWDIDLQQDQGHPLPLWPIQVVQLREGDSMTGDRVRNSSGVSC